MQTTCEYQEPVHYTLLEEKKKYKEIVKLKVSYVNRLSTIAATGGKIKAYLQNTT